MPCPYCGEDISPKAVKCRHCGEFLDDAGAAPHGGGSNKAVIIIVSVLVGGVCLLGLACVFLGVAVPNLVPARKNGNEAASIGALKTIAVAQTLFREADKEGDNALDYATLSELGNSMLIDSVLASGTKMGYLFESQPNPNDSEFQWMAVANPVVPTTTGDRYFVTNHEGVTYYRMTGPIPLTDDCAIPSDCLPVGR